ncbi:Aste57867_3430 [Aphanomyces stellatus]|uniref:Aste57867_3430 protein n=1 Tax=Aphanomyces stellatus TaxID=120398 RepID=A0A485KAQ5_9STRA|nr:hypothetical protein As57867_003420 [Aphanomyces stellatus]VFT80596.1 Aste57867_3430 [Aphanomyces stellatus]
MSAANGGGVVGLSSPPKSPCGSSSFPARSSKFRDQQQRQSDAHVPVDNAIHWATFFQAICPVVQAANPLRLHLADTVLLSPTGAPSIWYHSTTGALLKRKHSNHVTPNAILAAFLGPNPDRIGPTEAVAVCRFGFSSRLMSRADLEALIGQLLVNKLEPLIDVNSGSPLAPPLPSLPFCLQRYIKPADDKRYIVTFSLHPPQQALNHFHDSASLSAKAPSTCEVFVAQYSKRYNSSKTQAIDHADDGDAATDAAPPVFDDRKASFDFHTALGIQTAKVVSPESRMKHIVIQMAQYINSRHAANPIQGMVVEFVIGAADDEIYLTAILGLSWQDQTTPSWERLAHVDPESKLICQFYHAKGTARHAPPPPTLSPRPAAPTTHEPTTQPPTQTPRFPSVPNAQVADVWTRSLVSADRSPRYKNASPSKLFRDGRFVTKLSALQCESACRLHMPMHRACRPALLVDLARQVEDMREDLIDQKEKCMDAEERAAVCVQVAITATDKKCATDHLLEVLQRRHEGQREAWERRFMASAERETHAAARLETQRQHIASLVQRNSAQDRALMTELAAARTELQALKDEDARRVAEMAEKDKANAHLMEEREKARQQAIIDTIQREGTQSHIHSLRAQISLLKREKEVLRKEANRYMAERDDLLRVLPVVTSISDKKAHKPLRVNVSDLFEPGDNAKEINMLQLMLASHAKVLKGTYQYLTLQAAGTSSKSNLTLQSFVAFAKDCGFMAPDAISVDGLHSIVARVTKDERKASVATTAAHDAKDTTLTYAQFCECLIRIAHVLYKVELPQLTKRFACLIENDLATFEKAKFDGKADD